MEYKDYYKILGVPRKATEKEIRDSYRKLARKFHPDVNPGDKKAEERFKEIGEAYAVLSDPAKRRKYDLVGPNWDPFGGSGFGRTTGSPYTRTRTSPPPPSGSPRVDLGGAGDQGGFGNLGPFSDFFEMLFGQQSPGRPANGRPTMPAASEHPVDVTLAEAFTGVERVVEVESAGDVCPFCKGSGRLGTTACPNCEGRGRETRTRRIEAKIPAGVETGSRITLRGGGGASDLLLVVNVLPDPTFRREGANLYCDVPVDLTTAMLGGELPVPTPLGKKLMLTIPPESGNGQQFILRGQGMPRLKAEGRGDMYAKLNVVLPRHLTPQERELFQELARSRSAATAAR